MMCDHCMPILMDRDARYTPVEPGNLTTQQDVCFRCNDDGGDVRHLLIHTELDEAEEADKLYHRTGYAHETEANDTWYADDMMMDAVHRETSVGTFAV